MLRKTPIMPASKRRNKEKYPNGCFVIFQLEIMQINDKKAVRSTMGILKPSTPRKY